MKEMIHIIERDDDKTLYEPSRPSDYDEKELLSTDEVNFYFREIKEILPKRFFWKISRYEETGRIWRPKGGEFTIVERNYIIVDSKKGA